MSKLTCMLSQLVIVVSKLVVLENVPNASQIRVPLCKAKIAGSTGGANRGMSSDVTSSLENVTVG